MGCLCWFCGSLAFCCDCLGNCCVVVFWFLLCFFCLVESCMYGCLELLFVLCWVELFGFVVFFLYWLSSLANSIVYICVTIETLNCYLTCGVFDMCWMFANEFAGFLIACCVFYKLIVLVLFGCCLFVCFVGNGGQLFTALIVVWYYVWLVSL